MSFPEAGATALDLVDRGNSVEAIIPEGLYDVSVQWLRVNNDGRVTNIAAPAGTANPYIKQQADMNCYLDCRVTSFTIGARQRLYIPPAPSTSSIPPLVNGGPINAIPL